MTVDEFYFSPFWIEMICVDNVYFYSVIQTAYDLLFGTGDNIGLYAIMRCYYIVPMIFYDNVDLDTFCLKNYMKY
jgi:hypothetical protein